MLTRIFACAASRRSMTCLFVPTLAITGAVLAPGRAYACGASPPSNYTIDAVSPAAGSVSVARDVGIVITASPSLPSGAGASHFADVKLIDIESDAVVPVSSVAWYSFGGPEASMAVHPVEPLAPQHAYRLEVTPIAQDGEAGGSPPVVSSFTTSDTLLEPLVLSGEIELSLRGGEADVLGDCPLCGGACARVGKRPALFSDVRLPAPSGGQGTYRAKLHFSDHVPTRVSTSVPWDYEPFDPPHDIHLEQYARLESGEALVLEQEVFEEALPYAGCFTFVVWDPAGHTAQTSACLPSLAPEDIRALRELETPLELAADDDDATEQVQVAAYGNGKERNTAFFGCGLGANAASGSPGGIALLVSLVLLRRRRP